jgi:hypothetical protein
MAVVSRCYDTTEKDTIFTLPSGTELSVEAAQGDLSRAIEFLDSGLDEYAAGLVADLLHVSELLDVLLKAISTTPFSD